MTCNMSFTAQILQELGGFDPAFDVGQEDVEFGLRAKRQGEIVFAEDMLVYHRIEPYSVQRIFTDAGRYKTQVMIFKRYRTDEYHRDHSPPIVHGIFLKPEDWQVIFLPFLLFRSPANQSLRDFLTIPLIWLATLYRRWVIWTTAFRERILLI
jgi:GT2 family glycosyltransferase